MGLFSRVPAISPREAAGRLSRGELELVDVRETSEVAAARVPGARHIPLGQLPDQVRRLDRARPVAFICRSGARSARATKAARDAGLDARNVSGGIVAWARQGLALTHDDPKEAA